MERWKRRKVNVELHRLGDTKKIYLYIFRLAAGTNKKSRLDGKPVLPKVTKIEAHINSPCSTSHPIDTHQGRDSLELRLKISFGVFWLSEMAFSLWIICQEQKHVKL